MASIKNITFINLLEMVKKIDGKKDGLFLETRKDSLSDVFSF